MNQPRVHSGTDAPRAPRWVAVWLALTVWALGVFAASPDLHATLHAGDHHESEADACAVTLFAHGADTLGAAPDFALTYSAREIGRVAPVQSHEWTAPAHRLQPACGPPLS